MSLVQIRSKEFFEFLQILSEFPGVLPPARTVSQYVDCQGIVNVGIETIQKALYPQDIVMDSLD